jgi:hypothetical protein
MLFSFNQATDSPPAPELHAGRHNKPESFDAPNLYSMVRIANIRPIFVVTEWQKVSRYFCKADPISAGKCAIFYFPG